MNALRLIFTASLLLAVTRLDAQDGPRWMDEGARSTPVDTALAFSTSGMSLTVLFNDFVAEAGSHTLAGPVTRTATFSARPEGVAPPVRLSFVQHLRGAIQKDPDARIVLVLVLPDRTETLVFPYGERVDESTLFRRFRSSLRLNELQEYAASVFVRIDRRRPGALARVDIDSFDVTMARAR